MDSRTKKNRNNSPTYCRFNAFTFNFEFSLKNVEDLTKKIPFGTNAGK